MIPDYPTHYRLLSAAHCVREGGIIVYPTEAVMGLGCDPFDEEAVSRLLAIKQRPVHKGLIVIADSIERVLANFSRPPAYGERLQACWPGPYTFLLPLTHMFPAWIHGGKPLVAIRVPGHAVARELASLSGGWLVSTSANRSGEPAARKWEDLPVALRARLDGVVNLPCGDRQSPSVIENPLTGEIVRD